MTFVAAQDEDNLFCFDLEEAGLALPLIMNMMAAKKEIIVAAKSSRFSSMSSEPFLKPKMAIAMAEFRTVRVLFVFCD